MHILCPVDFSPTSERALDHALALAKRLDGRVTLFHAYDLPNMVMPDGALLPDAQALAKVSADHQQALTRLTESRAGAGVALASQLKMGPPAAEIVAAASQAKADMIVMGTHGRSGLEHALLGSVAERVVRASQVPVLTIRDPHADDRYAQSLSAEIKCIACPVDFSDASTKAVTYATTLARRLGAELHLVHVYSTLTYAIASESYSVKPDLQRELKGHVQAELEALATSVRKEGITVTTQLIDGVPHKALHEAAQKRHAQWIVMGTHGRTGFERLLLGSVTEKVVRTSTLPVLTVHPQG